MAQSNERITTTAAIAAGASLSAEVDIAPFRLTGLLTDANWTAATISLLCSTDGTTFQPVQVAGGALTIASVPASTFVALDPSQFRGLVAIKVQSGSVAAPANQVNATTVTIVANEIDT